MTVSVILTTYESPAALALVLWGYAVQDDPDFELVVADDGSGEETTRVIERVARDGGRPILHVWHPDRGFRKTEILNRAILRASGDYLVFSDGDCIPRSDFVSTHRSLARPGRFLSGGYLKLPEGVSAAIGEDDVRSGNAFDGAWLRSRGWKGGKRSARLTRRPALAAVLDGLTSTRRTWNGHNASGWSDDLRAVNGFDLDMGYGGLDRALGERLMNAGVLGRQIRYRAPCLHLFHPRPYRTRETIHRNRQIRRRIRQESQVRAPRGLAETPERDDEAVVITRPHGAPTTGAPTRGAGEPDEAGTAGRSRSALGMSTTAREPAAAPTRERGS